MKNLYQQTRFDFPMPIIKFLCINCSSINNGEIIKSLGH